MSQNLYGGFKTLKMHRFFHALLNGYNLVSARWPACGLDSTIHSTEYMEAEVNGRLGAKDRVDPPLISLNYSLFLSFVLLLLFDRAFGRQMFALC